MIDQYINKYGKRLYGLCRTLCANIHDADDLYQETWLKVLRYIDRYDPEREFEGWLTTICVNIYRNSWKRMLKNPVWDNFTAAEDKEIAMENMAAEEPPDYSDLHAAINRLPEKLRMTVILFYFRDMDITETAAVLKVPEGTVKSRLNKARKLLKEVLTSETDLQF